MLVRDKDSKQEEILAGLDYSSFQLDKSFNSTWQITFTAYKYDDSIVAFNLLQSKAQVKWHGQWFSIEQPTYDVTDGIPTKKIVATHGMFTVKRWRPNITPFSVENTTDDNGNTITATIPTYSANQLMHMAFDGNKYGYSIEVIGNDTTQISSMDRQSALDMINTYIINQMGWVYTADNNKLIFQSLDSFKKETGKVINYDADSTQANIAWDVTSLANVVRMYGKDNAALGEYRDDDSISAYGEWYGDDVTSDDATSASQLNSSASKSVNSTSVPTSTFTVTYKGNFDDFDWGDIVTIRSDQLNVNTEMMIAEISATPYTFDPTTYTVTTGNSNKANVNSLLQVQRKFNDKVNELSALGSSKQKGGSGTIITDNAWTGTEVSDFGSNIERS